MQKRLHSQLHCLFLTSHESICAKRLHSLSSIFKCPTSAHNHSDTQLENLYLYMSTYAVINAAGKATTAVLLLVQARWGVVVLFKNTVSFMR